MHVLSVVAPQVAVSWVPAGQVVRQAAQTRSDEAEPAWVWYSEPTVHVVHDWHWVFRVPVQPPVVKDPLGHEAHDVHVCVPVLAYVPLGQLDTQAPLERYEPAGHEEQNWAEPAEHVRQEMSQG